MDSAGFVYIPRVIKSELVVLPTTSRAAVSNARSDHKLHFTVCTLGSKDPGGKGNFVYQNLEW